MQDQRFNVGGAGGAMIDDEIRVLFGHGCSADPKALQARTFDQACGMVARRIGEYRTAAPFADRLGLLAALQQLAYGGVVDSRLALELQSRGDEPFIGGSPHAAVPNLIVG